MKITIEINDVSEFIKLKDWLNAIPEFESESKIDINKPIDALTDISALAKNCLYSENICTIDELIKYSSHDLLMIPTLGKKSLAEITDALSKVGLSLSNKRRKI